MHSQTQVWLTAADAHDVKLVDHDQFGVPGLADIDIGDVKLSFTEGDLRSGNAFIALDGFLVRLTLLRDEALRQRRDRRLARAETVNWDAADQAVTDHETATILREAEEGDR